MKHSGYKYLKDIFSIKFLCSEVLALFDKLFVLPLNLVCKINCSFCDMHTSIYIVFIDIWICRTVVVCLGNITTYQILQ